MTDSTMKKVPVKIYAVATTDYTCSDSKSAHDMNADIYFPTAEGCNDRDDLGCDSQHISVDGKDEMVFVDKGFLMALIEQNQRLSSNYSVYDDTNKTAYEYSDLNNLVLGMTFSDEITMHGKEEVALDADRKVMAENVLAGHDFKESLVTDTGNWATDGDEWSALVYLEDASGSKATCEINVVFESYVTNVKTITIRKK
jgi:hypothetical protein